MCKGCHCSLRGGRGASPRHLLRRSRLGLPPDAGHLLSRTDGFIVLRHFRAFPPHLETEDPFYDWQHYSHVLRKQACGEQESSLCMGNAPKAEGISVTFPASGGHGISQVRDSAVDFAGRASKKGAGCAGVLGAGLALVP